MKRLNQYIIVIVLGWVFSQTSFAETLVKESNHVYICTFNVYKLGSVDPKYDSLEGDGDVEEDVIPERIKNLANVLAVGRFDLVALQEVTFGEKGEWVIADLVKELKDQHGIEYSYFLSDHIGKGLMPEAMAFLYNAKVVKAEKLSGQNTLHSNINIEGRDLVRTQWQAGDFDFTMFSAHLAWGSKSDRIDGYEKMEEILTTTVPSPFSQDPDIIVLGDFNRFGKGYKCVEELSYDPDRFLVPNITIFDPGFNIIKEITKTSIQDKNIPEDNPQFVSTTVAKNKFAYDMILFTKDVAEEYPAGENHGEFGKDFGIIHFDEAGGFGFQGDADTLTHNQLKMAYSDHRPLWMRFKTNAGQSDNAPSGVTISTATTVYVGTAKGKKFHRSDCYIIKQRETPKQWTDREAALAERQRCRVCEP
ncbi:MAG: exonuclease/endonuclease/phosphatase family protein [Planctomycetota bacterium]